MDESTYTATLGSGLRLDDVTHKLYGAGKRAMAHGVCPQVGSGGHFTIGGLGPTSRQWGSSLDHIEEAEVVLANSSIVRASDKQYQDVFFAIKGAAASFGIVTEFKVRTEPAPGLGVQYIPTSSIWEILPSVLNFSRTGKTLSRIPSSPGNSPPSWSSSNMA